jgi:hypothetical protein
VPLIKPVLGLMLRPGGKPSALKVGDLPLASVAWIASGVIAYPAALLWALVVVRLRGLCADQEKLPSPWLVPSPALTVTR